MVALLLLLVVLILLKPSLDVTSEGDLLLWFDNPVTGGRTYMFLYRRIRKDEDFDE